MESRAMNGTNPHELIVKFWPPSVTAKGVQAINAVRRPLAFAVYSRPFVAIAMGLLFVWAGNGYLALAFKYLKGLF
jgi:hypothetical protein